MTESSSPIGIEPSLGSSPTHQKLQCKDFVWFCIAASFDTFEFRYTNRMILGCCLEIHSEMSTAVCDYVEVN